MRHCFLLLSLFLVGCSGSDLFGGGDGDKQDTGSSSGNDSGPVEIDPITGKPINPDDPDNPGGSGGGMNPNGPRRPLADCDTPGPRMIRRLTDLQYKNTLKELLGPEFPAEDVLTDPAVNGFHVDADAALVTDLTAELLMNYAERVAAWTIENQSWKLANCNNHEPSCHEQVVREFGQIGRASCRARD